MGIKKFSRLRFLCVCSFFVYAVFVLIGFRHRKMSLALNNRLEWQPKIYKENSDATAKQNDGRAWEGQQILPVVSENLGLCKGVSENKHKPNMPRKLDISMKIQAAPEYQEDFWGIVDFNPVPPFHINTHDPETQDVYISGSVHRRSMPWDHYIWDLFVRVLDNGNIASSTLVVDVGANIGYFSLLAASLGCKVISFEPMNRNVAKFLSSISRNNFGDRITVYQNAVTYYSGNSVSMAETHTTNQGNGQIKGLTSSKEGLYGQDFVDTIKIDDVVQMDVMLMKIDVEGFEGVVLNGAKKLICWNIVRYITIELSHETRQNKDCPVLDMLLLLESFGYVISDVVPDAPRLSPANFADFPPNILFSLSNTTIAPAYRVNIC